MENKVNIPEGYLPLLEKMSKNLNEEDLKLLNGIIDWSVNCDKKTLKNLSVKMTSWLWPREIYKFMKLCYFISMSKWK